MALRQLQAQLSEIGSDASSSEDFDQYPRAYKTFRFQQVHPLVQLILKDDPGFPKYDEIKAADIAPAMKEVVEILEADLYILESSLMGEKEPSWDALIRPYETLLNKFLVVSGVIVHLKSVKDSVEMRSAKTHSSYFQTRLEQNNIIFEALTSMSKPESLSLLPTVCQRTLQAQINEAVLNGAALPNPQKQQFNGIKKGLQSATCQFRRNALDSTTNFTMVLTSREDILGLPPSLLAFTACTAASKGITDATSLDGPWVVTLAEPCYLSFMKHARKRSLREELYKAYISRASAGACNNIPVIEQILKFRQQKAKLLGFNNYAELSLNTKMASLKNAEEFLENLRITSLGVASKELKELEEFSRSRGDSSPLCSWDIEFWKERLWEEKYNINEEELRQYFTLPNVMEGIFDLAKRLFDIDIVHVVGEAQVWHEDVTFYCVRDLSGDKIAHFYFDPYSRAGEKQVGSSWTSEVFVRLAKDGITTRLPLVTIVCNLAPPLQDKPSLLTFREVITVFHEFGHALQHMLTTQGESLVSGVRGIEWDAVEFPSQFMERWCLEKATLMCMAKHSETGHRLQDATYQSLLAANNFFKGFTTLHMVGISILDMELHKNYDSSDKSSLVKICTSVISKTHVIHPLEEDRSICSMGHIFAGAYDAAYYSYLA